VEPTAPGVPPKLFFIAGSSFSQGDQASHLWKSATCENAMALGAATVRVRETS
jgi:hypothetical protein